MADFIPDSQFKPDSSGAASSDFIPDSSFKPDNSSPEQEANAAQAKHEEQQSKYGGLGQQALAGVEGAAKGLLGPLAVGSAKLMRKGASALGVSDENLNRVAPSPESMEGREEANPVTSLASTAGGLMSPIGQGALLEKAGAKVAGNIVGEGVLKGMSRGAVKLATENALYQSGDEISKLIKEDPNQTVGSAISNIGLAGLIGGAGGAVLGSVSPLWKAANETKIGELISDFKTRVGEHLSPESAVVNAVESSKPHEVYDPFVKENTTQVSPPPAAPHDYIDPFTKEVTPRDVPERVSAAMTPGGKLADLFIKHSSDAAAGAAASLGAALGHMTGVPGGGAIGALLGERSMTPLIKSIMPTIAKALLEKTPSAEGLKAAVDYGLQIVKGKKLQDSLVKDIFSSGSKMIVPEATKPSADTRKKLDSALQVYQKDPARMASIGGSIGHYMPEHAVATGGVVSNTINFLNTIRPSTAPRAPLDPPVQVSQAVKAQYERALDIAQQPLVVLQSIKNGTITSHDVMALHTMYPQLYAGLRQNVMNQMIDSVAAGEVIPYTTRMGLSMFLQQPLDSTMQQQAIMAAQPIPEQPQEQQQASNSPKKVSNGAANNMIKGSKMAQTQVQASAAMHSSNSKA